MALKDRFRKAIGRTDRSSSCSSTSIHTAGTSPNTGTTTPVHDSPLTSTSTNNTYSSSEKDKASPNNNNTLSPSLTKTSSRLTKTLTWRSNHSSSKPTKTKKKEQKEKEWAKKDAEEWSAPMDRRPGQKNQKCQDTLRAFDFKKFEHEGGDSERSRSVCSGISPSCSRTGSVDDAGAGGLGVGLQRVLSGGRKRSGGNGMGKLSQEVTRGDVVVEGGQNGKKSVGTVREE